MEEDEGAGILCGWGIGAGIGAGGGAGGEVLAQKKDARMGNFQEKCPGVLFPIPYISEYDVEKYFYRSDMR